MKAKIRGTEIYFDVAGMQLKPVGSDFIEKPVMFMLHGGPGGDHLRYKQHSLELQEVAQLVFIDHRGCGRSKKSKQEEYSLENNIEALRQYLGLERICVLGTSYGGIVAQGYAARYHKDIEKLILVVTAPSYRSIEEAKKTLIERGNSKQVEAAKHLWNGTFKNHKQSFSKSKTIWSHEALNEDFGNFLQKFNFIPQLKKIKCPTLILAGQKDWISSPDQSKIIAQKIPNSRLKIFKNCGHALAVDAHDKYINVIKKFLKNTIKKLK